MIKKMFITILVLIVLAIIGFIVFLLTFDLNHYREFVQNKLSKALDYPVQIGSMHTKLSLIPTIQINNFKVFQNGKNPKVILDVPQVEATLELVPLLKKKIEINRIEVLLVSVDLSLLSNNKTKDTKKENTTPKIDTDALVGQLWVDEIVVNKVLCRFMNKDKKVAVELDKFSLKGLNRFKFDVEYQKNKFNVDGAVGLLTRLIANPQNLPIDLKIKQGNASATLKGQIGDLPNMDKIRINTNLNIAKSAAFLKTWNINIPRQFDVNIVSKFSVDGNLQKMSVKDINIDIEKKAFVIDSEGELLQLDKNPTIKLNTKAVLSKSDLAEKLQLNPFELSMKLNMNKTSLSISNINFRAGRSDILGTIKINWKDLIHIEPNLSSSYLNLKDIINQQENKPTANRPQNVSNKYVIPNTQINWDMLKRFNLKGNINISHLFLTDQTDYVGITLEPKMNQGHLEAPFHGRILAGSAEGKLTLDANRKIAGLKFSGQNLELDKIRSLNKTIKGSKINTEISLDSNGNTTKALASNLNGKITLELMGGTIMDEWFNSLPAALNLAKQKSGLLDFSTSDQKTEIMCGAMNIPIKNGIITSDGKIALQTDGLNFVANGQINLKNETIDMSVVPSVNQTRGMANQLLTTIQAIHFKGPWKNIQPSVDTKKILENITQVATQKLNGEKAQVLTSTDLCQKILGKKTQTKPTPAINKKKSQPTTATKQPTKKENLKQQLMNSLAQALQQNKVQK